MPDDVMARLARLEAEVERLKDRLAELEPDVLTPVLRRAMGDEWTTSGELWKLAQALAQAAAAQGLPRPELPEALEDAGIGNAHALGRWLAQRDGAGFERGPSTNAGTLWRCS